MDDVTFLIKTFERPDICKRLLTSLLRFYSDVPVVVADDSLNPCGDYKKSHPDSITLVLPYDVGLSAGRNTLLQYCETEYFVLLDDDFVFTKYTEILPLMELLRAGLCDIAGGGVKVKGEVTHFEGFLDTHIWNQLKFRLAENITGPTKVDVVLNFFAGVTDTVEAVGWDKDLKLGEHLDFFLRCKEAGLRVVYHPDVICDHCKAKSLNKHSVWQYRKLFQKKRGLSSVSGW